MGAGCLLPPIGDDYARMIGLWQNAKRIRLRRAWGVGQGVGLASGGDIPRAYFEAVANTEHEADAMEFEINAARREQASLAKYGFLGDEE